LNFPALKANTGEATFRITAAIDFRKEKALSLYLPKSGVEIGMIAMIYAHPFQPFEMVIEKKWLKAIQLLCWNSISNVNAFCQPNIIISKSFQGSTPWKVKLNS
jgi:hypothetical protein